MSYSVDEASIADAAGSHACDVHARMHVITAAGQQVPLRPYRLPSLTVCCASAAKVCCSMAPVSRYHLWACTVLVAFWPSKGLGVCFLLERTACDGDTHTMASMSYCTYCPSSKQPQTLQRPKANLVARVLADSRLVVARALKTARRVSGAGARA